MWFGFQFWTIAAASTGVLTLSSVVRTCASVVPGIYAKAVLSARIGSKTTASGAFVNAIFLTSRILGGVLSLTSRLPKFLVSIGPKVFYPSKSQITTVVSNSSENTVISPISPEITIARSDES